MPQRFSISCPLNQLSFGHVSFCLLKELHKRQLDISLFPIGGNMDLSSFDGQIDQSFLNWIQTSVNNSILKHKRTDKNLRMWHIQSSMEGPSKEQSLMTFFELDSLTAPELNILSNQENIFVTNEFTKKVFEINGVNNVTNVSLGFDSDSFQNLNKPAYSDKNIITFGVFGKMEKRKGTEKVIRTLCKLYGNNPNYRIHCQIFNPFLGRNPQEIEENNKRVWLQLTDNNKYFNIVNYAYTKTLKEYNQLLNSVDGVIDGGANEGFSIPSFSACCIGKHVLTIKSGGVTQWANENNSVQVLPSGKEPCYDGVFFHPNAPFNQGNFFTYEVAALEEGIKKLEERIRKNKLNEAGLELQKKFIWKDTVDKILEKMGIS